jgi:hypothetical protein
MIKTKPIDIAAIEAAGYVIGADCILSKSGKPLKPGWTRGGYYQVSLMIDGRKCTHKIHRLIAAKFLPNPDGLPDVNHLDEDKSNNHYSNLMWCTRKHNINYGTGRARHAEACGHSVIGPTGNRYESVAEAARATGVHRSTITDRVQKGFGWRYAD